jgi:SAM-dependent methyltransferase
MVHPIMESNIQSTHSTPPAQPPEDWYSQWFNKYYLQVYSHRNLSLAICEVAFIISVLGLKTDENVLDLCCGGGRHLQALQSMGYTNTIGVDLSIDLLDEAQQVDAASNAPPHFPKGEQTINLVRADMRHLPFQGCFDAILSLFNSFGYFFSDEENKTVLNGIYQSLRHRGRFFLDLVPYGLTNRLVAESDRTLGDLHIVEKRSFNQESQRIEKRIEISGPPGLIPEGSRSFYESFRVYTFGEIRQMLAETGLYITGAYGNYSGEPFLESSDRMIVVGRRSDPFDPRE